jgi:hypothetical protein
VSRSRLIDKAEISDSNLPRGLYHIRLLRLQQCDPIDDCLGHHVTAEGQASSPLAFCCNGEREVVDRRLAMAGKQVASRS